jgi:hypothetical protein
MERRGRGREKGREKERKRKEEGALYGCAFAQSGLQLAAGGATIF